VGKTYRKSLTDKSKNKKRQKRIWKKTQIKNLLKGVVQDYENEKEMSKLSDEYNERNIDRD
tara:strand:+ start:110 stop:292 length:183 start_codon:yes stop_codon:yes gene_type:complete